jgi:MYXO-CTERM domain-containing protein
MTKIQGKPSTAKPAQIPKEGALGLLALGAVGLRAWRKVRDADKEKATGKATPDKGQEAERKGE